MSLITSTTPIPVITALPPETLASSDVTDPRPASRSGLRIGVGVGLGLGLIAAIALNWHLILGALTTLAVVSVLSLGAFCILFRIVTGGRLGSAAIGALITAFVLRRRR
jgi:uncharacterized membrane protein YccC